MSGDDIDTRGLPASSVPIEGGIAILNAAVPPGHPDHVVWRPPHPAERHEQRTTAAAFHRANGWSMLRIERDRRLRASDWIELPSAATRLGDKRLEWYLYRQLLRDLPAATIDPDAPDWPAPPA